uniref:Uncharacterized protein LOC104249149 n=1 Tax=Nicotiana sylvestris TaxID=4096 RepID=A0A1U7YL30_NICSY|nr:PREDICTED: uncharacterized protein LOC104249149 [Nicotiana sylvestris]
MDFRHDKHDKGNGKESRVNNVKGGGDRGKGKEIQQQYSKTRDFNKLSGRQGYAEKKAHVEKKGCYICRGPHGFRNCPDLKSLSAMVRERKEQPQGESPGTAQLGLKTAVTEEPVLALPDFAKTFEVHTDASDFAIGGVLMQDKHLIAFESRKLNEMERRYMTCLVCQQDKVEQQQPGGLLEPLPVAERPWESVTMDFITCLPKFDGYGASEMKVELKGCLNVEIVLENDEKEKPGKSQLDQALSR